MRQAPRLFRRVQSIRIIVSHATPPDSTAGRQGRRLVFETRTNQAHPVDWMSGGRFRRRRADRNLGQSRAGSDIRSGPPYGPNLVAARMQATTDARLGSGKSLSLHRVATASANKSLQHLLGMVPFMRVSCFLILIGWVCRVQYFRCVL